MQGPCVLPTFAPDTLFLFPALQKWPLRFLWSFFILLSRICPNCACTQLFLVLLVSLYFVARGDVCPGSSPAAKGLNGTRTPGGGDFLGLKFSQPAILGSACQNQMQSFPNFSEAGFYKTMSVPHAYQKGCLF